MKGDKTVATVLERVQETLFTAKLGFENSISNQPKVRIAGIRNLIVFGRAVTIALQNFRGLVPKFDEWYKPYVDDMQVNPLFSFFNKKRNEILKEGRLETSSSATLSGNLGLLLQRYPKPPRAKSFFVGDRIGGSGWEVELSDGTTERYYVEIPEKMPGLDIKITVHFTDAPEEFKALPASRVCQLYYDYLAKMVTDAKRRFSESNVQE